MQVVWTSWPPCGPFPTAERSLSSSSPPRVRMRTGRRPSPWGRTISSPSRSAPRSSSPGSNSSSMWPDPPPREATSPSPSRGSHHQDRRGWRVENPGPGGGSRVPASGRPAPPSRPKQLLPLGSEHPPGCRRSPPGPPPLWPLRDPDPGGGGTAGPAAPGPPRASRRGLQGGAPPPGDRPGPGLGRLGGAAGGTRKWCWSPSTRTM